MTGSVRMIADLFEERSAQGRADVGGLCLGDWMTAPLTGSTQRLHPWVADRQVAAAQHHAEPGSEKADRHSGLRSVLRATSHHVVRPARVGCDDQLDRAGGAPRAAANGSAVPWTRRG